MAFNKRKNKETGNSGEEAAANFLIKLKYKILGRNINLKFGEIDILAEDKKSIVIVEVKTVRGGGFGLAQELVRYKKQQKLKLLARALSQQYPNRTIRIDVIGVDYSSGEPEIEHLINCVN